MINPKELSTDELYFGDADYMSVSRWKKFNKCELDGLQPFDDTNKSTALMVGSYVDAYIEGTLDNFKEKHPEIISSRGATKGQLKKEFKLADEICEYMESNAKIMQFLGGEKQTVMTGEINTIPFKIKIDSYHPDKIIVDLKCMRSVTDKQGNLIDFITPWGYHYQMACYQEIVFQNTGNKLPCYILAVTKETPINSVIVQIPQEILDRALYEVSDTIIHYDAVKKELVDACGCGACGTCVSKRTETPLVSMFELLE